MKTSFQSEVDALRVEISGVIDEIAWTTDAPLPPEEVKQRLATIAKALVQKFDFNLLRMTNPDTGARELSEIFTLHHSVPFHGAGAGVASLQIDLSAILLAVGGDDLIKRMAKHVDNLDYVPGPPSKDRAGVIVKLRDALHDLEQREERLICEAEAAGVYIARRDDADPAIVLSFDPVGQIDDMPIPGRRPAGEDFVPTGPVILQS
jgi:hypothetical protein